MKSRIFTFIENCRGLIVELQRELTCRPAVSPDSGGEGELEKALFLQQWLAAHGICDVERHDAPDVRAKGGVRPNLVVSLPGTNPAAPCLWVMCHLDVVPPGEGALWESDPWVLVERDGRLIGRGTEDNQQGLTASVVAALALRGCGIQPERTIKLLFVADEECGSVFGIDWLLKNRRLFGEGDTALVPDSGDPRGLAIEIAEKNLLWVRVHTKGLQTHASRPELGVNAHLAGAALVVALHEELSKKYAAQDALFEPPYSTFQVTKKEANVPNINTIPGDDVFYLDMRILPCYTNDAVLEDVARIKADIEKRYAVTIGLSVIQAQQSRQVARDAPVTRALAECVREVYGECPRVTGIGGGTVAAHLRNAGIDALVWGRLDGRAHEPNEYALVDNIVGDAKVMALLMLK
ncbi:MAG: M20 family metallo-hydrolase [Spirochaetaceae bacterium]|jgi:succinyl-diaminopimelate desuccinylase|nr:M20 family metallo-hydrolase [Spirochaetaceae bacterium]